MASAETPSEPISTHGLAKFTMAAALAGAFRPHGATEQRAASIEPTLRITDHPAVSPGCCICWSSLGFHHQGHRCHHIATVTKGITVTTLHHKEGLLFNNKPPSRLWWIFQINAMDQTVATDMAQFNKHGFHPDRDRCCGSTFPSQTASAPPTG